MASWVGVQHIEALEAQISCPTPSAPPALPPAPPPPPLPLGAMQPPRPALPPGPQKPSLRRPCAGRGGPSVAHSRPGVTHSPPAGDQMALQDSSPQPSPQDSSPQPSGHSHRALWLGSPGRGPLGCVAPSPRARGDPTTPSPQGPSGWRGWGPLGWLCVVPPRAPRASWKSPGRGGAPRRSPTQSHEPLSRGWARARPTRSTRRRSIRCCHCGLHRAAWPPHGPCPPRCPGPCPPCCPGAALPPAVRWPPARSR